MTRKGWLVAAGAILGVAVVVLVTLAAVGTFSGHDVNEDDWRGDLASAGVTPTDWPAYRDVWLEQCEEDDTSLQFFLAIGQDNGDTQVVQRLNLRHACPDRADELDDMLEGVNEVQVACDTPAAARTESQQRLAEASGC